MDQAPRLVWTTLHYGAARPERLRRHAAHPELDVVGFELDEHGGLVIDAGGKKLIPGRLPVRPRLNAERHYAMGAQPNWIEIVDVE